MFKKKSKPSSQNLLSSKDKKDIKAHMVTYFPEVAPIFTLPLKQVKHTNPKCQILYHNQTPLLVHMQKDYFPTIQLLKALPLLPKVTINDQVIYYLKKGAKLMSPGIKEADPVKKDSLVMVVDNQGVRGVGLWVKEDEEEEGGIACIMLSVEGDWLSEESGGVWEGFNELQSIKQESTEQPEQDDQEKTDDQTQQDVTQQQNGEPTDPVQEDPNQDEQTQQTQQENQEQPEKPISKEEMDAYITEAFLNAVKLSDGLKELPMDISNVYSNQMLPYKNPNINLDLKNSQFKKISQFFKILQKQGLVEYKEAKKNMNPMITKINYEHPQIVAWQPTIKKAQPAKQPETKKSESSEYPKIQISEVFRIQKKFKPLFGLSNDENPVFHLDQIKNMILAYIKENLRRQKDVIFYDPQMAQLFLSDQDTNRESITISDFIRFKLEKALITCHQIVSLKENKVQVKLGKVEGITLLAEKQHNKNVTKIRNLELFQVPTEELPELFQKKFACSCAIQEIPGKPNSKEIYVQGNFIDKINEFLQKEYKIYPQYITVIDKLSKKKKN